MLIHHFPKPGSVFRQRAIRYLSVVPAEWIQALPRHSNCPPKPDTIQKTAGDQAPTHHWTGENTYCICMNTHSPFDHTVTGLSWLGLSFCRTWNIWVKVSRGGQGTPWLCYLTHYCTPMLTLATSSPLSFSGGGTNNNTSRTLSWGGQHLEVPGM